MINVHHFSRTIFLSPMIINIDHAELPGRSLIPSFVFFRNISYGILEITNTRSGNNAWSLLMIAFHRFYWKAFTQGHFGICFIMNFQYILFTQPHWKVVKNQNTLCRHIKLIFCLYGDTVTFFTYSNILKYSARQWKNYEADLQHLCVSLSKLNKDEWRHKDDIIRCSCLMLYLDLSFRKANMLQRAYLRVIYEASSFCWDAKFISFLNVDSPFIVSLKVFQQH